MERSEQERKRKFMQFGKTTQLAFTRSMSIIETPEQSEICLM